MEARVPLLPTEPIYAGDGRLGLGERSYYFEPINFFLLLGLGILWDLNLTNVLINARLRTHVDIAMRIYPATMASATVETAQNIPLFVQDAEA